MASARCISSSLVQASSTDNNEASQRIDLTPWDLQLLPYGPIQKGLLFHKPKPQQVDLEETLIHHLKASLSRSLDFFPPLAGRLAFVEQGDDITSYYQYCNNAGALFVHATADGVSISDIIDPVYVPGIVRSFFPLNGVKNIDGTSKPVLAVQVTELVDGVFIGCTVNHTICDGKSFWHFLNSWCEICGGANKLSKPPTLQRWFLNDTDCPIRLPNSFIKQIHDLDITPLPMQERVFHFSKENIAKLKAKANAELGTSNISSLQALLSHIWLSVMRTKHLDPEAEINYRLPVGIRQRLDSVPEEYFGNAVQAGIVILKVRELLEQGIGNTALQMNKMVATHNEEEIRNFLESWAREPRLVRESSTGRDVMGTSCSPRFDVYGNDFGWGRPIAVRSGASNKVPGLLTVYRGVEEGDIDVEACLSPDTLEALANDYDFMNAVTTIEDRKSE
ncbi:hypothetical protein SLEP1_g11865 [Rubroshorea leprosula]|nr:hypothetical protein SLEP1_g11865 [Rubroshorea leprosula]